MTPRDRRIDLTAPRYTTRPFPPYRFTPGRHPHPVADPRGHSYEPPGHVKTPPPYRPPEDWRNCDEYLYGCDLYNHGYWWEAHEAWEDFWRVVPPGSAQKHLLQGLIQVAACHLKLYLATDSIGDPEAPGHLAGVARLRSSAFAHLDQALQLNGSPRLMGLDLSAWPAAAKAYFHKAAARSHPDADSTGFPYLVLD